MTCLALSFADDHLENGRGLFTGFAKAPQTVQTGRDSRYVLPGVRTPTAGDDRPKDLARLARIPDCCSVQTSDAHLR